MVLGIFHGLLSTCYGKKKIDHLSSTSGFTSNFVLFFSIISWSKAPGKIEIRCINWKARLFYGDQTLNALVTFTFNQGVFLPH